MTRPRPDPTTSPQPDSESLDIGVYGVRGVPSTYSGYETFLTTLLPELVRMGDEVTVYCRPGEAMTNDDWEGVHRKVLPAIPGKNLNTLSHGAVAAVAARLARHDVVLAVNVANAPFCLIGRATRQPVVLNTDGQEWLRDKWGPLARSIFHRSARIAGRCATALIADCDAMAAVYREEFAADSTVIPYCIPSRTWTPDPATPRRFGLEPYGYVVVAGRHNPENNVDRVAEYYASSDLTQPLVVLGAANYDSPVTARVKALADTDPRIIMLGHISDRDTFFDLQHHASVYVHGHSVGGTNPALVEAMAAGARICAHDNPFNRETIGTGGSFFRLGPPMADPSKRAASDIVEVLRDMLAASRPDADVQRDRARLRAADRFATKTVVDAYRELLAAAARTRRGTVSIPTLWSAGSDDEAAIS